MVYRIDPVRWAIRPTAGSGRSTGLVARVVVEAAPGLAPVSARPRPASQRRRLRRSAPRRSRRASRRRSRRACRGPTKSASVSGPIGWLAPAIIPRVDVLDRADALLVGADRVEHVRDQQPVDDEAAVVAGGDGRLAELLAELEAESVRASSPVSSARTTSSSGITWAGLKKCRPRKRSGARRSPPPARRPTSDEVLVAKKASGLTIASTSRHISSLRVEVLGDRLDHEVAVGEVGVVERRRRSGRGSRRRRPARACPSRPRGRAASRSCRGPRRACPGRPRGRPRPSRPGRRSARSRGPSGRSRDSNLLDLHRTPSSGRGAREPTAPHRRRSRAGRRIASASAFMPLIGRTITVSSVIGPSSSNCRMSTPSSSRSPAGLRLEDQGTATSPSSTCST